MNLFKKALIIKGSEETCGECGAVFDTDFVLRECACGANVAACNACIGSTDEGPCPIECIQGSCFRENAYVHIVYWIGPGCILFLTNLGTSGSEPHTDVAKFKEYWDNMYKGAKIAYGQI